jgi:streptogramin lyase
MQQVGNVLYHAYYNTEIEQLDPVTGAAVGAPIAQPDVVGMANVGGTVWISHWGGRTVGTWDPGTNVYTPMFSTPSNAGGLAYDPDSNILWVGLQGGFVVPYTLAGVALNAGFQPFGAINDTIDGLTFRGEGSQVPEPASLLLVGSGLIAAGRRRWQNRRKNA